MNDINYTLAYDISTELSTEISYFPFFASLLLYATIYFTLFHNVKDRRILISVAVLIFPYVIIEGIRQTIEDRDNNLQILKEIKEEDYNVVEGAIENYIPHDSYNRKSSHFELQGVSFGADYSGFDVYYKYPLKLREGRRLKIFYKMKNYRMVYKLWVEDEDPVVKCYAHFNRAKQHLEVGEREEGRKSLLKILDYGVPLYDYKMAGFFQKGVIFDKNTTKALELYKKACDGGEKKSCDAYELLLKE